MLPETIFTVETMAEHNPPAGSNPHTVGYFYSRGDAEYARSKILGTWPNATVQEYPIGTLLSDGCDVVGQMFYLYNAPRDHYIGPFGSDEKARAYQREPIPGVNASFEHVTSIVHIRDIPPGSKCSTPEHGPTDFWGNGFLL